MSKPQSMLDDTFFNALCEALEVDPETWDEHDIVRKVKSLVTPPPVDAPKSEMSWLTWADLNDKAREALRVLMTSQPRVEYPSSVSDIFPGLESWGLARIADGFYVITAEGRALVELNKSAPPPVLYDDTDDRPNTAQLLSTIAALQKRVAELERVPDFATDDTLPGEKITEGIPVGGDKLAGKFTVVLEMAKRFRRERDDLRARVAELEAENARLREERDSKREDAEDWLMRTVELETELSRVRDILNRVYAERDNARDDADGLRQQVIELEAKLNQ